jgi:hypothetical protein
MAFSAECVRPKREIEATQPDWYVSHGAARLLGVIARLNTTLTHYTPF